MGKDPVPAPDEKRQQAIGRIVESLATMTLGQLYFIEDCIVNNSDMEEDADVDTRDHTR